MKYPPASIKVFSTNIIRSALRDCMIKMCLSMCGMLSFSHRRESRYGSRSCMRRWHTAPPWPTSTPSLQMWVATKNTGWKATQIGFFPIQPLVHCWTEHILGSFKLAGPLLFTKHNFNILRINCAVMGFFCESWIFFPLTVMMAEMFRHRAMIILTLGPRPKTPA